ncbi:fatty acid acyl transferase-related [Holotrichia oblita]|uniref:Fatty acid acyl transferase-related n=1 Tax=Holotrichia oblita TaxID=644536 RepID=A0ACB9T1C8_HOLOL|nr:fatty acid acyl transferase-related [Holotrichia oblita]
MALVIKELLNFHDYALDHWKDPRVDDWLFMSNVWNVVAILAIYLYLIFNLGPKLMENRKPFDLKWILIMYNSFQVLFCCVVLVVASIYIIPYHNFVCAPVDDRSFRGLVAAHLAWWYFFSKIIDLLDTNVRLHWAYYLLKVLDLMDTFLIKMSFLIAVHEAPLDLLPIQGSRFCGYCKYRIISLITKLKSVHLQIFFILRKKNNHVTFLHVYHHSVMYVIAWAVGKFIPGTT